VASDFTSNREIPNAHPELFHYTTIDGLRGIVSTESLWATHYSTLNDSTEINFVKQALKSHVAEGVSLNLRRAARQLLSIQRNVRKYGGLKKASSILAEEVLSVIHGAAFESVNASPPLYEPYIVSFCSHAKDEEYERAHGLLSQWRAYGGAGGYCVVFDTAGLMSELERESRRYFWSYMDMDNVTYSNDDAGISNYANKISKWCKDCVDIMLTDAQDKTFDDLLVPYLQAATLIKHRGFVEEREVRIIACPMTKIQIASFNDLAKASFEQFRKTHPDNVNKSIHRMHTRQERRYIVLFENILEKLPIKRVIVGPSLHQQENRLQVAKFLESRAIPLNCSETPFIGPRA
jgi:hypothetical protein